MIVKVKVSVTESDIDNGIRGDCWKCPVAIAMWRATGVKWNVGNSLAYVTADRHIQIDLPEKAVAFIDDFDYAATVYPAVGMQITGTGKRAAHPFDFEINVPEEYVVTGAATDCASRPAR